MIIFTFLAGFLLFGSPAASKPTGEEPNEENRRAAISAVAEAISEEEGATELFFDHSCPVYDSLRHAWYEQNSLLAFDNFFDSFIDISEDEYLTSEVPDSVYESRLKMILSPVPLPYNDIVKRYIIAYTTKNKTLMCRVLGRSQYYFPMIEEELDRAGLPLELRMLPVVESALTPSARSHKQAVGLWQFILPTGKRYGLEITSFIDQRREPVAATRAAVSFLGDLYKIYGDWLLVLAAYNCGPGNVDKALKRAGSEAKSFWDIYAYLPKETRGYVPSFIGATYAYYYHRQHNLTPDDCPMPLAVDTIQVNRVMHFDQITSTIGTSKEMIQALNPQYIRDIVPAVGGKTYSLILPISDMSKYVENEQEILDKDMVYLSEYLKPSNIDPTKKEFSLNSYSYTVKSGDNLSSIAKKNGVTSSQIIKWNNLKNPDKLRIGQKLEIYR